MVGGVRCGGVDRDDAKLGVTGEVHETEVVSGTTRGLREHGDDLARGGGGGGEG